MRRPLRAIVLVLPGAAAALLYFALGQTAASGKSAAFDEAVHLLSGYRVLTESDHVFNHEHPPLMKVLAAAPVVMSGAAKPLRPWTYQRERDEWPRSHEWLYHANDADRLLAMGRMPNAVIGACLALLVFVTARRLACGSLLSGSVAAALFALEPNLLAHGSLVTTDMGMAAFFFAATVAFQRFLETRRRGWLGATGVLWGVALLTKFTSILLGAVFLLMGALDIRLASRERDTSAAGGAAARRAERRRSRKKGTTRPAARSGSEMGALTRWWSRPVTWGRSDGGWIHLVASTAAAGAIALAVLNAGYGFDGSFTPLSKMGLESAPFRAWAEGEVGRIPLPVPAAWVGGYDHAEAGGQRWWSYLMGRHSMTGRPHYYLVALLVKTPIPLMLLAAAGLILWRRSGCASGRSLAVLSVAPAFLIAAFTVSMNLKNIGLRYVLPVHPFLCVMGGLGAAALWPSRRPYGAAALVILLAWSAGEEALIYPDHLAYFNEIAGGPDGGRWWLLDSNLDWGQDLKGLGEWIRSRGVAKIFIDYFGRACPRYYGIRSTPDFEGGYIAVSATNLAGVYRDDKSRYDFLAAVKPVASIGHSILVYDVPRPPGWTALPEGPLE